MRFSWKIKINKTRIIVWQVKTSYDIKNHIIKRQTVFWVKASLYDTFAQSHRHKASALLRCLNTVCARSTICTADMNKRAHKALRKTNMEPVHLSFHFVQWRLCKCFFRLNNETVCYVSKTFVFQCLKGNTIGKHPAYLGLFVWIKKDRESCQMQRMRS